MTNVILSNITIPITTTGTTTTQCSLQATLSANQSNERRQGNATALICKTSSVDNEKKYISIFRNKIRSDRIGLIP